MIHPILFLQYIRSIINSYTIYLQKKKSLEINYVSMFDFIIVNYKKVKFACASLLRSDLNLYKHRYFGSNVKTDVNVLELKRVFYYTY